MSVYRAELDLRPPLTEVFRALRDLGPSAPAAAIKAALRGSGRYARSAGACALLVRVLTELGLIELDLRARSCRVLEAVRSELERSPTYRVCSDRLAASERALAPELPRTLETAATA
jgi:hypothetical protein